MYSLTQKTKSFLHTQNMKIMFLSVFAAAKQNFLPDVLQTAVKIIYEIFNGGVYAHH